MLIQANLSKIFENSFFLFLKNETEIFDRNSYFTKYCLNVTVQQKDKNTITFTIMVKYYWKRATLTKVNVVAQKKKKTSTTYFKWTLYTEIIFFLEKKHLVTVYSKTTIFYRTPLTSNSSWQENQRNYDNTVEHK